MLSGRAPPFKSRREAAEAVEEEEGVTHGV